MKTIKTTTRTYYTLNDLLAQPGDPLYKVKTLDAILDEITGGVKSPEVKALASNPMVEKLWQGYIFPSMYNQFVSYSDEENKDMAAKEFFNKVIFIFRQTLPYYEKLITLYETEETNLMKQLTNTSKTTSRRNDTPQEKGNWDANSYTSEVNSAVIESTTDVATVEDRLDNIRKKWVNVYNQWLSEFDKLVIFCYN